MNRKIKNPQLFDAVFEAAFQEMHLGNAATLLISANKRLVRITEANYVLGAKKTPDKQRVIKCLKVYDGRADSVGEDGKPKLTPNRFTGSSHDGSIIQGGVYFSMDSVPMILETAHYGQPKSKGTTQQSKLSINKGFSKALRQGKAIIVTRVKRTLSVLDLSSHQRHGQRFVARLEQRQNIQQLLKNGKTLWDEVFASDDYSVARAIGLAAGHFRYLDGVLFKSARTTLDLPTGDNVALFGRQGHYVSSGIELECVRIYQGGKGKGVNPFVEYAF